MTETFIHDEDLDLNDFTPAMRQFIEVKRRYPETLVLFRMGDFYETFFDNAAKANRLIGITLTKRGKLKNGDPIPMAGIPMVSLDQYVARLVRLGESVVIAEQLGTPGKGLMERRISRIITPGTLTDTSLLPEKDDAVLLSVSRPAGKNAVWGFAWLTLSNGDFFATEVTDEQFDSEVARISPSEVLVSEKLRDAMRETHPELTVTPMPAWHFDAEHGEEALKKTFGLDNLDAWGVTGKTGVLAAANALLDYTAETQVDMIPFISPLKLTDESEYIIIDPASRRNLEISDTIRSEGRGPTLFSVLDRCGTSMGSRELRRWLNLPLTKADEARGRHDALEALAENQDFSSFVETRLQGLPDIERIASRIALGTVRPKELAALRDALPLVGELNAEIASREETWFGMTAKTLSLPAEIFSNLEAALLPEPATLLREGDVIRSDFNEELGLLRQMRDNTGQFLLDLEKREREKTGLTSLRVEYNRVHGFYIEVSKGQAASVPVEYHRRQTLKNTERFITPELKNYEDQALSSKERSAALEKELYDGLVASLAGHVPALMAAARALAQLDVVGTLARHAVEHHWVRPTLTARPGIEIIKGRHPVVETTIESYVPSDCRLGDGRRCLIITGPNMGGKSTYMRAVALITLLAWAGSFVPAESVTIGPVDRIHTRIGASDDLARGRSTFMVEMTEAAAILHQATDRSLVLMDEIGRGTATFDGLSLAGAIAQELVETTRSLTLFATHYFELTQLAVNLKEAANVHVSAAQTRSKIVFLHEIEEGPASRSYGIAVAQLAGVPAPVVRRARAMLTKLENREAAIDSPQADLFGDGLFFEGQTSSAAVLEAPAEPDPALREFAEAVAGLDVDSLTPREALAKLYEIREEAVKAAKGI